MASISVLACRAPQEECPEASDEACAFSSARRTESSLAETQGNSETKARDRARARPNTSRRLDTPLRLVEMRNHVKAATHNASQAIFNKEFANSI